MPPIGVGDETHAFSIGLSAFIATLLVLWRRTGREHYHRLARFWTKIFAVSFAMGVVSGIPLSYEFGTHWSRFSLVAENVIGPLIGYEVLTAFFLEASFLGVMLFGWQRVKPWLHLTAAVLVALGTGGRLRADRRMLAGDENGGRRGAVREALRQAAAAGPHRARQAGGSIARLGAWLDRPQVTCRRYPRSQPTQHHASSDENADVLLRQPLQRELTAVELG